MCLKHGIDLSPFGLVVGIGPTVGGDVGLNNQGRVLVFVFHVLICLSLFRFVRFVGDGKLDSGKGKGGQRREY